jgi:DNA-binding GntR family transcriptional regulator
MSTFLQLTFFLDFDIVLVMVTNSSLKRLNRKSLATDTADYLREAIIAGSLQPGKRLLEVEISSQLGISRGTLREALQVLENEGIVESSHGRGKFVMSLSERAIEEIYSIRSILEQEAIRLAVDNIDDQGIAHLQTILTALFDAAKANDINLVISTDFEFHQKIWEIADNQLLERLLHSISQQARIYLAIQVKLYDDLVNGISDHEQILENIRNRDGEKAAVLIKEHMTYAREAVIEYAHEQES